MSKLVYNELYKLFHKRSTKLYFLIVFLILFMSLVIVLKFDSSSESNFNIDLQYEKSIIDSYKDRNDLNDDQKNEYLSALIEYDKYSLIDNIGIKRGSPEEKYVKDYISDLFYSKNFMKVYGYDVDINNKNLDQINKEIDEEIKKLENFDALAVLKEELKTLNKEEICSNVKSEFCDSYFNAYKRVLEYRIDNNIPKADVGSSMMLDNYLVEYPEYLQFQKNKDKLKEEEKESYNQNLSYIKLVEYKLDHKLLTFTSETQPNLVEEFSLGLTDLSAFIIVGLVMIAASILSEEFEKGTVKLLLVKPFSRNKILISKILASFVMIVVFSLYVTALNFISSLIYNGYLGNEFVHTLCDYNFTLNKVVEYNVFNYYVLTFISQMIYFIIFDLIVICFSTFTTSTAISTSFGFGLLLGSEILIAFAEKFKWIPLLPMYTSNMSNVFFGKFPEFKVLTLPVQIFFNCFYVVLFVGLALFIFKRKDIKNQ